jgi:hypothetical protein
MADQWVSYHQLKMAGEKYNTSSRWSDDPKLHELGRFNQLRLSGGIEGFMLRLLTTSLEWPYLQAQVHLAKMRSSIRDYRTHAYLPVTIVTARKPFNAPEPDHGPAPDPSTSS